MIKAKLGMLLAAGNMGIKIRPKTLIPSRRLHYKKTIGGIFRMQIDYINNGINKGFEENLNLFYRNLELLKSAPADSDYFKRIDLETRGILGELEAALGVEL